MSMIGTIIDMLEVAAIEYGHSSTRRAQEKVREMSRALDTCSFVLDMVERYISRPQKPSEEFKNSLLNAIEKVKGALSET